MRIKLEAVQCKTKTAEEGFKDFWRYCRVKNLSDRTLDFYEECFERFCNFYSKDEFYGIYHGEQLKITFYFLRPIQISTVFQSILH